MEEKNAAHAKKRNLGILALYAVILAVTVFVIYETFRRMLPGLWEAFSTGNEAALLDYLNSQGTVTSYLTLWFLSFVQVLSIVLPVMPVQLAAGIAYGTWLGSVTTFTASVAANMVVFLMARRLTKTIHELMADSPKIGKLLNTVRNSRDPWFYTALAFMTPGLPNGAIPYAAAQAGLTPGLFLAAICISTPIPTILTCAAGDLIMSGDWLFSIVIGILLYACVGLLFWKREAVTGWIHAKRDAFFMRMHRPKK